MSLENFFENFFLTDDVKDKIQIDRLDTELNKTYNTHSQDIFKMQLESKRLKNYIEQLALLFRTLYDICIEKNLFTKTEFKKLFDKIDMENGKKDGRIKQK